MSPSLLYSRRKLLAAVGLGGAGLVATSWTSPLAAATSSPLSSAVANAQASIAQASLADVSALIGHTFTILNGSSPFTVTLVSATAMPASGTRPAGLRPYAIAIAFEAPNGPAFPAGNRTYMLQLANGAQVQLFLNAKSVTGTTGRLTAILN